MTVDQHTNTSCDTLEDEVVVLQSKVRKYLNQYWLDTHRLSDLSDLLCEKDNQLDMQHKTILDLQNQCDVLIRQNETFAEMLENILSELFEDKSAHSAALSQKNDEFEKLYRKYESVRPDYFDKISFLAEYEQQSQRWRSRILTMEREIENLCQKYRQAREDYELSVRERDKFDELLRDTISDYDDTLETLRSVTAIYRENQDLLNKNTILAAENEAYRRKLNIWFLRPLKVLYRLLKKLCGSRNS